MQLSCGGWSGSSGTDDAAGRDGTVRSGDSRERDAGSRLQNGRLDVPAPPAGTRPTSHGGPHVSYPAIAEHGLIGDLQTAALVTTDGTVDWFCCPRFDSPTVFAALLDDEKGGRFSIAAVGDDTVTKQMYLPDTAVLITRYLSEAGVAEVFDLMPLHDEPERASDHRRLIRGIRGVRGEVTFDVRVEPRFDYARQSHRTKVDGTTARFESDILNLDLVSTWPLEADGNDVRARITVRADELGVFVLESGAEGAPTTMGHGELIRLFDDTVQYWHGWVEKGTYRGRWREAVYRSAITLKLMTYAPTGGLVAAPTGGLPEQVGGERNWDYRYTWVRDASFSVYALLSLGFLEEAAALGQWLRARVEEAPPDAKRPLNIMYRIDGSSDLVEFTLDHLDGYRGSRPVRIGNGAADQLQLDIYGEFMDTIYLGRQSGIAIGDAGWRDLVGVLNWVCDNWDQPDEGIWETRGGQKPFVYGRLMCWVALERGIRTANERALPAPVARWTEARDQLYEAIMDKGWNEAVGAFTQYEGSEVLDASILLMPFVGFIVPDRSEVGLDAGRDGQDPGLRQPRLPLRPGRLAGRSAGIRGHVLALHVLVRRRPRPLGPAPRRAVRVREDADLRQPRRALLRGDRRHRRAARQLPPGLHPPLADQRGARAQPSPRRGGRVRRWRASPARSRRGTTWSWASDCGRGARTSTTRERRMSDKDTPKPTVLVVGGGFAGVGCAHRARRSTAYRASRCSTATTTTSSSPCSTRWRRRSSARPTSATRCGPSSRRTPASTSSSSR